ncbi:MAG: 4Fe-4S binding protein [Nitrososphaerales archaeon]
MGGTISTPGSSVDFKVGEFRTIQRPVIDLSRCTKCYICWAECPEPCIHRKEDGFVEIDYDFCKGCGICAEDCPVKCIHMVPEAE